MEVLSDQGATRLTVLLAEDSASIRLIVASFLHSMWQTVVEAREGNAAREAGGAGFWALVLLLALQGLEALFRRLFPASFREAEALHRDLALARVRERVLLEVLADPPVEVEEHERGPRAGAHVVVGGSVRVRRRRGDGQHAAGGDGHTPGHGY